jgi:transposase
MFLQRFDGSTIRKAILMYEKIKSFRKVASIMNVGKSTIHRWYNRFHRVLSTSRRQKKHKRRRKLKYPSLVNDLKAIFHGSSKLRFTSLTNIMVLLDYSPSLSTLSKYLKKAGVSRRRFTNFMKVRGEPDLQRIEVLKTNLFSYKQRYRLCS